MVTYYTDIMKENKKQTAMWLPIEIYEWLRETAFKTRKSQSSIVESLLQKEKEKDERRISK